MQIEFPQDAYISIRRLDLKDDKLGKRSARASASGRKAGLRIARENSLRSSAAGFILAFHQAIQ